MSGADKLALPFWRGDLKLLKYGRNLNLAFELAAMKDFKVKVWVKQLQLQCDFWAIFERRRQIWSHNETTSANEAQSEPSRMALETYNINRKKHITETGYTFRLWATHLSVPPGR